MANGDYEKDNEIVNVSLTRKDYQTLQKWLDLDPQTAAEWLRLNPKVAAEQQKQWEALGWLGRWVRTVFLVLLSGVISFFVFWNYFKDWLKNAVQ